MIYGISGASGTGKTTLAKAVAEDLDIHYQASSITECANKHGFNPVGHLPLPERMELQKHLLHDHVEMINQTKRPMITDRTPIDMIGYLMCEFHMQSHTECTDKLMVEAEQYVAECLRATNENYDHVFHLGQLHIYEVLDKRPAHNPAYSRHIDLVMKGALFDLRGDVKYSALAGQTLDFRQSFVTEQIIRRLDALDAWRKTSRQH